MALRPDEISALIKEQIKHYDDVMEQKDVGTVMTVGDGVAVVANGGHHPVHLFRAKYPHDAQVDPAQSATSQEARPATCD